MEQLRGGPSSSDVFEGMPAPAVATGASPLSSRPFCAVLSDKTLLALRAATALKSVSARIIDRAAGHDSVTRLSKFVFSVTHQGDGGPPCSASFCFKLMV